ncbi:MAG: response regulator transcription factor [Chloroflexi bacterium]|nr:response regulator transcription factor [Chloroflexota bacterium]
MVGSPGPRVLIAEDDTSFAEMLRLILRKEGFDVLVAKDGAELLQLAQDFQPQVILLDVMMPRMDGWEACWRIRHVSPVPIIMVTALGDEASIVRGLELGADDYLVKPFGNRELIARLRAALRRQAQPLADRPLARVDEHLVVDRSHRQAILDGKRVRLSATEYRLLDCFLSNANRVLSHQSLLTQVWGWEYAEENDYLKAYIYYLRRKIERNPGEPRYILCERGLGYRFWMPGDGDA